MEVTKEGLVVREISKDITVDELKSMTEAELIIPNNLAYMAV
ncbi:hypothetical protein SDC9_174539 [bioreactor metagenome]|uniref:Uncharacterized protein n=2 Tax=root TaxID=1 RepID=A0A645GML5_9ZZZZ